MYVDRCKPISAQAAQQAEGVAPESQHILRSLALQVVAGGCSTTWITALSDITERTLYVDGKKFSSPYSTRTSASSFRGTRPRTLSKMCRNFAAVIYSLSASGGTHN